MQVSKSISDKTSKIPEDMAKISEDIKHKKYNLYNSDVHFKIEHSEDLKAKYSGDKAREIFSMSNFEAMQIMEELSELIEKNKDRSFVDRFGVEHKLGDNISTISKDKDKSAVENLPFSDLWIDFYENRIKTFENLFNLKLCFIMESNDKLYREARPYIQDIFGKEFNINTRNLIHRNQVRTVVYALFDTYKHQSDIFEISKQVLVEVVNKVDKTLFKSEDKSFNLLSLNLIRAFLQEINCYEEEGFVEISTIKYELDSLCDFDSLYSQNGAKSITNIFDYIKLYKLEYIDGDMLYKVVFEKLDLVQSIDMLTEALSDKNCKIYHKYFDGRYEEYRELIFRVYLKTMSTIIAEEARRSEGESDFSKIIKYIDTVLSSELLIQIINAIGEEKIKRGVSNPYSRIEVFSYLLKICKPLDSDDADKFKSLLNDTNISKSKLMEVSMYNSIWADIIGESIDFKDLKQACYFFIAHTDMYMDQNTIDIIESYTSLEIQDLRNGAFDIEWFKKLYQSIGKNNFDILYKNIKYICDGNQHTRIRYICDAVTGKLNKDEVKNKIIEKRNKNLLISYALIPLEGEEDLFERYEYIDQFLKESKKFGAQRRNSEKIACEMAIRNLAVNRRYKDYIKLSLYKD